MRNAASPGNTGSRVPSNTASEWRMAPPPYHAAVNKLRTNGVPGSHPGTLGPNNQNKSENSAFSPTLHVSKC